MGVWSQLQGAGAAGAAEWGLVRAGPDAQLSQRDPFAIWWAFGRTQSCMSRHSLRPQALPSEWAGRGTLAWMVLEKDEGGGCQ